MFDSFKHKKQVRKLFYHTDIHCHILPGVDHGSPDLDTSINLVLREIDMGATHIIATSHVTQSIAENSGETLLPAGEQLRMEIQQRQLPVNLDVSAEYRVDDLFVKQFKDAQLLPFPNNYLLIENSFQQERMDLDDVILELQSSGFSPILAHPERYSYYRHDRYRRLHERGVLFQVNIMSFAGYFGMEVLDTAKWLLNNDLIDFLGSDMHNVAHANVIDNYLKTKDYELLAERLSGRIFNDTAFS